VDRRGGVRELQLTRILSRGYGSSSCHHLRGEARPGHSRARHASRVLLAGTPNLLGAWDFEAGSGLTIADRSGNGYAPGDRCFSVVLRSFDQLCEHITKSALDAPPGRWDATIFGPTGLGDQRPPTTLPSVQNNQASSAYWIPQNCSPSTGTSLLLRLLPSLLPARAFARARG
jgi:hypothetical protein